MSDREVHETGDGRLEPDDQDRIARTVFADAEAMGVSDRKIKERVTREMIRRIEQQQASLPLPGMEHLVGRRKRIGKHDIESIQVESVVKEVLQDTSREKRSPEEVTREARVVLPPAATNASDGSTLSPNSIRVLEKRYLKKDLNGRAAETPEQMFRRVARCVASAELTYDPQAKVGDWEEKFYTMMASLEFLPNSPTLMNAGRELGQLSACFVLPIEDSIESIFEAVKQTALIHKSGGGTGFSFSRLRPESDKVGSTGGIASGPVSFMRVFDIATDVIKQGGTRRGANMAILNIDHPDILRFIGAKEKGTVFSNFNLSVAITEEFMKAGDAGRDYDLVNPNTKQPVQKLNAREVFDKIVDMAWRTGDPGIIFIDRINDHNPTPKLGRIESTNPCGEQPLLAYESCNLGSINLSKMLRKQDGKTELDLVKLASRVRLAVRFLDNVIDMNKFPSPEIEKKTKTTRKIGLGVMGFADMLIGLGIPYDSEEALKAAREVMDCIQREATEASKELARKRGTFPAFEGSIYSGSDGPRVEVRNATRTTIAPTGTLSIIAGCSSGIEPLFALSYMRTILEGEHLLEVNPYFEEVAKKEGFYSEEMMKELATRGSARGMDKVPDWVQQVFVTAHDITPEWHVKIQAAFQEQTNNAVSKTVNFPHDATREDVAKVYRLAYELGCKGITIYRDRSKESQVLAINHEGAAEEKKAEIKVETQTRTPRKRPRVTAGSTERVSTGCGNLYVTVNRDEHGICEVFSTLGKTGGCASAQLEGLSRLISLSLRSGIEIASIVEQLRGIRCPSIVWEGGHAVLSCADAIAAVLEKEIQEVPQRPAAAPATTRVKNVAGQCPDCGNLLVYQEGCYLCRSCGYTKCS
jgi:ribonucleoside-diphosphate reductase alpha chain